MHHDYTTTVRLDACELEITFEVDPPDESVGLYGWGVDVARILRDGVELTDAEFAALAADEDTTPDALLARIESACADAAADDEWSDFDTAVGW